MCENCGTQVKLDYHWTKATGAGKCSDWFCGACGAPYDKSRMAGQLVFADKRDPAASFVVKARMPSGTTQNVLSAIRLANLVRIGECRVTDEDVKRHGTLGKAFRAVIEFDNEMYYHSFDILRKNMATSTLVEPDISNYTLPDLKSVKAMGTSP